MDYNDMLKNLAKETGISLPSSAFAKPNAGRTSSTFSVGGSTVNGKGGSTNSSFSEGMSKCKKCGEPRSTIGWCKPCNTSLLKSKFGTWTSGNKDLDKFIEDTQINANTPFDYMRWILFESFTEVEFIARGGFGSVFSAKSENFGKVALKFLDNSEQLTRDFLDELQAHHRCSLGSGIIDCYGVSKDPETNRYVMVMRYAEQGDLRRYLSQFFGELSWDEKIEVFDKIVKGLQGIHDSGLVHRDFHSGNILRHEKLVYVTDLGMCRPVNESQKSKNVYGVLPYVAPEILRGDPYTQAADIYSLGMIMWEMSSNEPPFADRAHDYDLARDICAGLRPPIIVGTPKGYVAAMLRCWDFDPTKRPNITELLSVSYKWRYLADGKAPFQGPKLKKVKTGCVSNGDNSSPTSTRSGPTTTRSSIIARTFSTSLSSIISLSSTSTSLINQRKPTSTTSSIISSRSNNNSIHPQAFYTSRLLHYPNLPEPKNSDTYTLFDPATGELHSMIRKQTAKRDSQNRSSTMSVIKELPSSSSSSSLNNKGKESNNISDNSDNSNNGNSNNIKNQKRMLSRSMTVDRTPIDRNAIDKIRAERRKLSQYRWSSIINDLPPQVEISTFGGKSHKE
ncbi:hypothetical protein Glove_58g43 [Diversispora epigaea]|uniref:Protein kinase domain-containing protein n=1 Tax=Diversispora epigaea TaxID=1348612 RepID=A0A397JC50_9GLOM|nr:hypothetical protein Glove_58g43 [Diversispora epigaea]